VFAGDLAVRELSQQRSFDVVGQRRVAECEQKLCTGANAVLADPAGGCDAAARPPKRSASTAKWARASGRSTAETLSARRFAHMTRVASFVTQI
jgi:hypothetical protein